MSKKFQNKPHWKSGYSEHDFRNTSERRVTFKTKKNNKDKSKDWSSSIRAHLYDEDIDMGNIAGPSRPGNKFNRKGHRPGSPAPKAMKRKLWEGPSSWYRITLPYGNKYDKQFMQQTLLDKMSPLPFWPIAWKGNGNVVTFYVDDFKVAEKLHGLDYAIQMPDGFKLIIKVHYGSPNVNITPEMKDKMKLAMANRYNANNKALDLSKFHADPMLQDCFCALYKPIILIAVIEIIGENIPELEALSLNDNKIQILTFLKKYVEKLKHVKILHLGQNKIRDMSMLDSLIGMPLVELLLDGNPMCDKFKDKALYISKLSLWNIEYDRIILLNQILYLPLSMFIEFTGINHEHSMVQLGQFLSVYSEIRTRFPKIMKLDGTDLPPPISFDLAEEHTLPSSLQTFLCNAEGGLIVRQFLEQYFQLFDSDNRQMLVQAYHENAIFSMTMAYPYGNKDKTNNWLNWYSTDNRNIMRVTDPDRRFKLMKKGNVSIVSFLKDMPMSSHDIMNFKVDLTVFTPIMLSLTVSGMFKEMKGGHKHSPIRSFFRTLIIVPAGSGYCISNEELHITNATEDQIKTFKSTPPPPPAVVTSPQSPVPNAAVIPQVNGIDDATKQQMVETLSTHSGMNLEWTTKCLQETEWNFERASMVFNALHKQGGIPAEAFVK